MSGEGGSSVENETKGLRVRSPINTWTTGKIKIGAVKLQQSSPRPLLELLPRWIALKAQFGDWVRNSTTTLLLWTIYAGRHERIRVLLP